MNDGEKDIIEESMEVMTNQKETKKRGRKFLIVIGIFTVLAVSIFLAIKGNVFLSKNQKTLLAAVNTFNNKSELLKNINKRNILSSKEHSIDLDINTHTATFNIKYNVNEEKRQLAGTLAFDGMSNIDLIADLDSTYLKAKLSSIDRIFSYNYKSENKGYISDLLGEEFMDSLDGYLESIYQAQDEEQEIMGKLTQVLHKEYKSLEFVDGDKKEFNINGKKRSIKGYSTTITPVILEKTLNSMDEVVRNDYEGAEGLMDLPSFAQYKDNYDEILNYIGNDMPDIELIIYIYGNKIVCIDADWEDDCLQILFHRDKEKNQSIELIVGDDTVLEIKSSISGSLESIKIELDGESYGEFIYDNKAGDFSVELTDNVNVNLKGNIQATKDEIKITVDKIEYNGTEMEMKVVFSMKNEASFVSMSGQEFSIDTASQNDYVLLIEEISEEINDLLRPFGYSLY